MPDSNEADRQFDLGDNYSAKGALALRDGETRQGHDWFRKAIDAYEAALAAAPEDDVVLVSNLTLCIGARLFGLGSFRAALARYEEALSSLEGRPDLSSDGEGREVLDQARLNRTECLKAMGEPVEKKSEDPCD